MALLGVRLTTALAYVATVVLFAALLKGTAVPRPVAGALTAAVCLTGNLWSHSDDVRVWSRVGLGALLAFVSGRLRVASVLSVLAPLSQPGSRSVPRRSWWGAFPVRLTTSRHDAGCQRPGADHRNRVGVWQRRIPNLRRRNSPD